MLRSIPLLIVLVTLVATSVPGGAYGQLELTGELGVDLEAYGFNNRIKGSGREFAVDRRISNHFLDLRLDGPLLSPELFHLDTRALLEGTYYSASSEVDNTSLYLSPSFPTYHGSLSLFPSRSYPLRLYYNKSEDHSIRYEAQNRSKSDLVAPELAIVRRYQSGLSSQGLQWKLGIAQDVDFGAEVKQDEIEILRRFDFDENLDIWIDFLNFRPNPTASEHTIEVANEVPNDTVLVFVDLLQVDELLPKESVVFQLETGTHEVEVVPRRFNAFRSRVDVTGDMRWRVLYTPPAGSSDVEQKTNAAVATFSAGGNGAFKNESYYEYNDTGEAVQNRTTYLTNFSNNASYSLSRFSGIEALTTYSENSTVIDTISSQLSKSFLQQTALRLGTTSGKLTRLSYSYNWIASETDIDDFESTSQIFGASQLYPLRSINSTVDWRNTATLLADNRDYVNNQYVSDLIFSSETRRFGVNWTPRQQAKYTYSQQENPTSEARETEIRSQLTGDIAQLSFLGSVKVKGEYNWRKKDQGQEVDTKNRYLAEIVITKKFNANYRIIASTTQEKEAYGLEVKDSPNLEEVEDPAAVNPAREDQIKRGYKLDVQASPITGLTFGGNVTIMKQNATSISRLGASMNGKVPKLNLPIRWYVLTESRQLEGLPKQTSFTMETKLSYRFRRIALTLTHRAMQENLINEKYGYQEVRGEISRQFSVF